MTEEEHGKPRPKRVFINDIDSYSSKHIAKFLSTCIVGKSLEDVEEEDEDENVPQDESTPKDETFQIVGTISSKDGTKQSFAVEQYSSSNRDELLQHLMQCEVIVYNITERADVVDEACWAVSALHSEIEHFPSPKTFILVSTLMTWAMSKPADPDDPEIPLTEDNYKRKLPHPNFREHSSTEKLVLKLGRTKKSKLTTYVVATGLQYGMGEDIFHYFFKASWLGEMSTIPIFGPGTNFVPTIHVNDLAGIVQNIIDHKPKTRYFIAVDDSKNTLEDIVKTIAYVLGPGKTKRVPREEGYLSKALTKMDLYFLNINLRIESVFLKEVFNLHLVCETGIVENIHYVVDEYKQVRQLLPIKICLLGPPAVGKTSVAERLCKHYKLHHIKVKEAIDEKIKSLEEILQTVERSDENEEALQGAQDLLESLRDNLNQNGGRLDDHLVFSIIREKLNSRPCNNQGFVLDGYPETYAQAKGLFYNGDMDDKVNSYDRKIIPEYVFSLNATYEFLKQRAQNLPESKANELHYTQDEFLQRLAKFREANTEDETVLNYFDELEIHPEHIEMDSVKDEENHAVIEKIKQIVGKPMNYGLTPEEQEEEDRRIAEERRQQVLCEAAERELREAEEVARMAPLLEEWRRTVTEVKKQEHEMLEIRSIPLRNYLMKFVIPTLSQGMIECCKARPNDPVDFLAEYLLRNNSEDD
ncbi:adenylate kinase 7a [Chanos chanos]|uniref:Adenylate kinase 7a n=1 Tax=Chanos chanos TaxID=29144 RepID=A0A6J2V4S0_CHACN|nr:adenylate kinase 7-like [Chanos chanos]